MNGTEHYAEAERLAMLADATDTTDPLEDGEVARYRVACAQVHATLALAAATVVGPAAARYVTAAGDMESNDDIDPTDRAWFEVAT